MLTVALLALLAASEAPARDVSRPPQLGEGIRVTQAPVDLSTAPDVLEVSSGLVWLTLEDGTPSPRATKVPAGVYVTAAGFANLEASVRLEALRLRVDNDNLRAELAALRETPLPGVAVAPPVVAAPSRGWSTPVVVAVGVAGVLAGGYAGYRLAR